MSDDPKVPEIGEVYHATLTQEALDEFLELPEPYVVVSTDQLLSPKPEEECTALDKRFDSLCEALIVFHGKMKEICEPIPDGEFAALIEALRKDAQPGESHGGGSSKNFAMPIYDHIADRVESELAYRVCFRRADEHMKATGSRYYCLHCDGDCTPEHLAELDGT